MIAQFLCAAVLLMVSISTLVAHRLVIDHTQQSAAQWARAQAQALGQGGLMWALARLEDPRPLDGRCLAAPHGPGVSRFAEMAERAGAQLSCDVHDAAGPASPARPWTCRCAQAGSTSVADAGALEATAGQAAGAFAPGRIEWAFEPHGGPLTQGALLKLVVSTQWSGPGAGAGRWREQVLLRQDSQAVWRVVVGSWWDDRP